MAAALLYLAVTMPLARIVDRWGPGRREVDALMSGRARPRDPRVTKAFGEREVLHGVDLDRRASTRRSR